MTIEDLGYNDTFEKLRVENNLGGFEIGRVIAQHKERYIVKNEKGEFEAEITGNLRFSARSREDFPAVGDWVSLINTDSDFAIIHGILPRLSVLSRQAVGKFGERQIIEHLFLRSPLWKGFCLSQRGTILLWLKGIPWTANGLVIK